MMTLPSHMTGFLHELGPSTGVYSYVSYPSTILPHTPRAKYRNELQLGKFSSLFFNSTVYINNWYIFLLLIDWLHHILGSASFNSPNANIMQNKRVVRGNTYAQRVPMRTYNVTSTLEERDQLAIPGTPGIAQRRLLHQRGQMLPNLADGQIQVSLFFIYRSSHIIFI